MVLPSFRERISAQMGQTTSPRTSSMQQNLDKTAAEVLETEIRRTGPVSSPGMSLRE